MKTLNVMRPYVDRPEWAGNHGVEVWVDPKEVTVVCMETGLVMYCTPNVASVASALDRAVRWAARQRNVNIEKVKVWDEPTTTEPDGRSDQEGRHDLGA